MAEWRAILLIVAAGLLPGWLLALHLAGGRPPIPALVERLLASLGLGLAVVGWFAFFLAEIGLFSLRLLAGGWTLFLLVLAASAYRRGLFSQGLPGEETAEGNEATSFLRVPLPAWLEYVALGLWLVAALWLFFRPHEYFLGGADAGVYVNTAAQIAENGRILIEDPTLAELDPALYPAFLRERRAGEGTRYYLFPGFNVSDDDPGTIIPDFFHLHPVWQAIAYTLGGLRTTLLLPGLWALLGSLGAYLVLRQLSGWPVALLALAGLSLSAMQVWFARYPVTETLTQYLLWIGLWAVGAWLGGRPPRRLWALLAGLSLGQLMLVRIDTVFILALPTLIAIWLFLRRQWQYSDIWFFLPLALLTTHSALHAALISRSYVYRISYYALIVLRNFWLIPVLLALAGGLGLLLLSRYRHLLSRMWQKRALLLGVTSVLLLLLGLYGWFLRPVYGEGGSYVDWYGGQTIVLTDHENLRRLAWYLSPLGVWLGVVGVILLTWRMNRKSVALVGTGLFFSLLYLWRIQATPHQIYAMRRYVPVTLPFFVVAAAFLLGHLGRQRAVGARLLALGLTPLWLGSLAWSAQGFVSQVDNANLVAEVAALEERFEENAVIIFNDQALVSLGDLLGTPLQYLYDHDVFTLRNPEQVEVDALRRQLARWQTAGRTVYWIGDTTFLQANSVPYADQQTITVVFEYLEHSYEHKPVRLIPTEWVLPLATIQ